VGGTAEGIFQTTINAVAGGRITSLNVKVGDYVSKGMSLMTLVPDIGQTFTVTKIPT